VTNLQGGAVLEIGKNGNSHTFSFFDNNGSYISGNLLIKETL